MVTRHFRRFSGLMTRLGKLLRRCALLSGEHIASRHNPHFSSDRLALQDRLIPAVTSKCYHYTMFTTVFNTQTAPKLPITLIASLGHYSPQRTSNPSFRGQCSHHTLQLLKYHWFSAFVAPGLRSAHGDYSLSSLFSLSLMVFIRSGSDRVSLLYFYLLLVLRSSTHHVPSNV